MDIWAGLVLVAIIWGSIFFGYILGMDNTKGGKNK